MFYTGRRGMLARKYFAGDSTWRMGDKESEAWKHMSAFIHFFIEEHLARESVEEECSV